MIQEWSHSGGWSRVFVWSHVIGGLHVFCSEFMSPLLFSGVSSVFQVSIGFDVFMGPSPVQSVLIPVPALINEHTMRKNSIGLPLPNGVHVLISVRVLIGAHVLMSVRVFIGANVSILSMRTIGV